jgi:hypothetical protein
MGADQMANYRKGRRMQDVVKRLPLKASDKRRTAIRHKHPFSISERQEISLSSRKHIPITLAKVWSDDK